MIKLVRKAVYRWGFRPPLGSVFYSPTLDFYYSMPDLSAAFAEGMKKAMPYSEEDYERDSNRLEKMLADKGLSPEIVTTVHHVPVTDMDSAEAVMQSVRDIMDGRDWFEESPYKPNIHNGQFKLFFCPLCGRPLDFNVDQMFYTCQDHGGYDFRLGVKDGKPQIVVQSVRSSDGR